MTEPRRRTTRLDPLLVTVLLLLDLVLSWDRRPGGDLPEWLTPGYAAVGYLALLWRRRFPVVVFTVVLIHHLLAWAIAYGYVPSLSVWLGLFTVAYRTGRRTAVSALLVSLVPTVMNAVDEAGHAAPDDRGDALVVAVILGSLVDLAVFGVGRWAAWTVQRRKLEAERAAADAVAAERGRITRDLHDIVAHAVSLMVLQAAGAAQILRKDPDRAAVALGHVDRLGQEAVVELRRMLYLLTDHPDDVSERPLPGLRDLDRLLERTRAGGGRVELVITGAPAPLPPGVDLCAYRIVQEALTNSARYADSQLPIRVEVRWHPTQLELRIRDHAPMTRRAAAHPLSTGRGLIGMQERAASVGGRCHTGRQSDGGFLVTATLPVNGPPSPEPHRYGRSRTTDGAPPLPSTTSQP
ncbi:sensor histidine kinase [Streptomyces sp. CA-251387]|uniref:sensor histidine kinase n=1 Tax=Streptomyces sp. CA-251387 TaxID=3240064 RepID=UPI003D91DE24